VKTRDYAELCAQSCFSFLKGASQPEEMIQQASCLGYRALALADTNGFYGMVRAHAEAKQTSFKYCPAVRVDYEGIEIILLPRHFEGYKRLCRLLSEAYVLGEKAKPKLNQGLIETWIHPHFIHSLLSPRTPPSRLLFDWLRERISPAQLVTWTGQPVRDQPLQEWLRELPSEVPRLWTWDASYHRRDRFELYECLRAIRLNQPLAQIPPTLTAENFLKPLHELDRLRIPQEWTRATCEWAEQCTFSASEITYQYPREWLPEGTNPTEFLSRLCQEGIKKRYPQGTTEALRQQLESELTLISELQFEDYFLTVWDIVQYARSKNILCQGRGSAANSLVCYLLEVTSIDPVQMNLLFERFISKERNEPPDIDIDFEHERREEVIQYVYQKYGHSRAAIAATLLTYRTKSSYRDVGKALEVPSSVIDHVTKRISWREKPTEVLNQHPWALENPLIIQRWHRLAQSIRSFPRHLGQHTGGMIITQTRLDEICPIEPASMPGRFVVQWDKDDLDTLGLLKIDLLSLGMLTCLRKSFEILKDFYQISLELHTIPHDDPLTFEMICAARTVGVFQIESRAQMSMLPRLKPRTFYDLVVEVAIVRPGPIQGGMVHPYLRRRMGLETVEYAHPKLKPILEKTMGVPIFQEQVMKMAIEVAGYTPGEADQVRRAMGTWKKTGQLQKHAQDIAKRMMAQGVPEEFSTQVCQQILGFGEYGFPEAHAASFALLTYASSYLKAHYPEVFLCALLNSMPLGFYSLHALTSTFQREGLKIAPLHTEYSDWDHRLERDSSGQVALRLGFRILRGLSKSHFEEFKKQRSAGKLNLYCFNQDERSLISLAVEQENKRHAYWQSLAPQDRPLGLTSKEKIPKFPHLNRLSTLLLDLEVFSTSIQHHPAQVLKEEHWNYPIPLNKVTPAKDIPTLKSKHIFCFGIIQVVQSPPTANGIFFITLEDETGFINLVIKPPVYQKFKRLIQTQWALLISGLKQEQRDSQSILVQQIYVPKSQNAKHYSLSQENPHQPFRSRPSPRMLMGWS
jgi:error-prone DNA polymerase